MTPPTVAAGSPRAWLLASRPKTLPASAAPVILGWSLAAQAGPAATALGLACLAVAMLLQVAANLANDYFDARSGVDQPDRLGPVRVTHAGLLPARQVLAALLACLAAATLLGLWVASVVGWWLLGLGAVCLLGAVAYTAGPLPLARLALGEVAALVFFGPVACTGTFAVLHGAATPAAWAAGLIPGLHAGAIMAVNNLRDREHDARAGKRTLAVRLGPTGARLLPVLLVVLGNLAAAPLARLADRPAVLAALLLAPLSWPLLKAIGRTPVSGALNRVLARTGQWELLSCTVVAVLLHA
jgi:1,4-dihydroxy-2-naphthoate octaprenyltransferase